MKTASAVFIREACDDGVLMCISMEKDGPEIPGFTP
jgi:hypothetical protein